MVVNSMSYATYDSYKDSGVDWLGEIPSDWDVEESKWLFSCRKEKANKNDEQLTASQKYGVIPQQVFMDLEERRVTVVYLNPEILKHVEKGDFVISMRSFQGGIEYCDYTGSVSSAYVPLIPNNLIFSPFFKYLFKSSRYIEALQSTSNLVRDGQALRYDNFCMIPLPVVPNETQIKIANFLDQKTAQIDQAIALKQQQIEKLNEYKQIVIQNAVTKGLNPNAPMKNSGVEWIGNIPEHWDVKKNTHLFNKIGSGTTPTSSDLSYYDSGDINWLQTGDLNNDYIVATSRKINQKAMSKFSSLKLYDENSLVIAMYGATIGKVGLLKIKSTTNQACCVLGNSDKVFMKYIFYVMQFAKNHLISNSYGGGQPNINQDMIKNLRIPYPNLQEQEKIANYLDDLNEKIYKTSKGYQTQIDRLKEYKNILINQAVTGKIKI